MARCATRAGVVLRGIVMWVFIAAPSVGADALPTNGAQPGPDLFAAPQTHAVRLLGLGPSRRGVKHRVYLEIDGARAQTENWLHDAGFSLLEDHDPEGKRRYQLISAALTTELPAVRLHARVGGGPQLSAGLRPRYEVPAFGLSMEWQRYTMEFEGLDDRNLGWALMGRLRWSTLGERVQYGVALPVLLRGGPSVGVLLQLRLRLGD